jgi:uncharacterized membrane protein
MSYNVAHTAQDHVYIRIKDRFRKIINGSGIDGLEESKKLWNDACMLIAAEFQKEGLSNSAEAALKYMNGELNG